MSNKRFARVIRNIDDTENVVLTAADFPEAVVRLTSDGGARTCTLPDSTGLEDGDEVELHRVGANLVELVPDAGGDTINGSTDPFPLNSSYDCISARLDKDTGDWMAS